MILLRSKYFQQLDKALDKAIHFEDFSDWENLVSKPSSDGFLNIINSHKAIGILRNLNYQSVRDFFLRIDQFVDETLDPLIDTPSKAILFYQLWHNLRKNINDALSNSRATINIPESGGVLVYLGGLSICLVIKFNRKSKILKILEIIENPKSAFDFWDSISGSNMEGKNLLKEFISTGHKLIYHRGVLIHVDKRKDFQVFGPSIDTLLMNEMLSQYFFENEIGLKNAIEIGCGNGLLTVSLAKNGGNLRRLETVDVNFNAIYCVHKNLEANLSEFELDSIIISKINGKFDPNLLKTKYDLVVCNPPYIPLPPTTRKSSSSEVDYFTAVGGLELIDELLVNLPSILDRSGRLFLLISSLTYDYVINKIEGKFLIETPIVDGHEVLFDVEAVFNSRVWFDFLKKNGGLREHDGVFFHSIYPLLIKLKES